MKLSNFTLAATLLLGFAVTAGTVAAPKPTTTESQPTAPPEAVARWQDMKFGLFFTWGPVSLKGTELGHSRGREIPIEEYDNLYKRFNPVEFDADQWVKLAQDAGTKYIVFVTRHHDGFCMFDTKLTDYNIMHTPFGRDIVGELAAACHKQRFALGLYDSVCDWWHPDFPLGSPKGYTLKPNPNLDRYEKYLTAQVEELMTKYGPLSTLWFDWPQKFNKERGLRVLRKVRALQPDILVNDRLAAPMGKAIPGDYDTPEQKVGGMQLKRPWETCMTLGTQWAWKPNDRIKSLKECLHVLIGVAGGGGNLLLNTGPMPDGRIEPRQAKRLREIGDWLKKYGESIYGTRGGPFERGQWGAATRKGDTIYLHILDPSLYEVKLAPLHRKVIESRVLTGGTVTVTNDDLALRVSVPKADRHEIDTIVALKLDGPAADAVVKPWNLEELFKPPRILEETDSDVEGVKAIIFEGPPLQGEPTRVVACYGIPKVEPDQKVPAMVLLRGDTETDLAKLVKTWMDRGYAAIAMDLFYLEYKDTKLPLHDKMICQGVAVVILSHSLIRSRPQVDPERVGITGISLGGYATCIVAGVDSRFRFAAPVYGCGFLSQDSTAGKNILQYGPTEANYWFGLWDPAIYLRDVKMPMLWVSCTNGAWFPLDSFQESSRLPRAPRTLSVRLGKFQDEQTDVKLEEIHVFADSIVRGGVPLPKVTIRRRIGLKVGVGFQSKTPIEKVELNYTKDTGPWKDRKWQMIEPTVDLTAGTATATGTLPKGARAYFFNVIDSRGLVVSSDHFNVPRSAGGGKQKK